MRKLDELKNELVGKEFDMIELDNEMESLGFMSEADYIDSCDFIDSIQSNSIAYTFDSDNVVNLKFEVTSESGEDESNFATYVRIVDVEKII